VEALYVDDALASLEWAAELGDLPVSEPTSEMYVPHAVAADAAGGSPSSPGEIEVGSRPCWTQLGAAYRVTAFPGRHLLLDEIRVPARRYRLVPREVWRVSRRRARRRRWPTPTSRPPGRPPPRLAGQPALVVDLGAPHPVGRVLWWPSTAWEDTPAVTVAISPDGTRWERVTAADGRRPAFVAAGRPFFRPRNGWLEARVAARPVRYLRFASADPDPPGWGIAEVAVYEDTGPLAEPVPGRTAGCSPRSSGRGRRPAAGRPGRRGEGGPGQRRRHRTPPANGFLDSHGRHLPPARLAEPVRLRATDALLVAEDDAEDLRGRLQEAGVEFRRSRRRIPPPPRAGARGPRRRVPARPLAGRPGAGASGGAGPADDRGRARDARPVVGVRLEHPTPVAGTRRSGGRRLPGRPELAAGPGRAPGRELGWAGRTLFRFSQAAQELVLPATVVRHLRVELARPGAGPAAVTRLCVRTLPRAGGTLGLRRGP
jgi:hypothetical protein